MKRSNTSITGTGTEKSVDPETTSETPKTDIPNSTELPNSHRRCLRLDLSHNRDVFVTIFYRIWMYRKRHILTTLLQLLIPPMILIGMTAYLGTLLAVEEMGWSHYEALDETQLQNKICGHACEHGGNAGNGSLAAKLACYMEHNNTKFSNEFKEKFKDRLSNFNIELIVVNKRNEILKTAIQHHLQGDDDKYIGGIEVQNPKVDAPNSPFGIGKEFRLQFTVFMAQKVPGFNFGRSAVFFDLQRNDPKHYYQLLGIQLAVFRTFYEIAKAETGTNISQPLSIDIQSLSYPNHTSYRINSTKELIDEHEMEYEGIDPMLAAIFVLSLVPVFYTVVEGPVLEKEYGFKLYLQLMGLPRGAYWFHWILNQMIIQLVVIGIQVYLIFTPFSKVGALVKHGDVSLWVMLLILYNFSSLSFFVFIAAFCRRGKMATYIGILIWLLSFHMLQSNVFDFSSSFSLFMVSCLLPSGCIHWAVYILATVNSNTWDVIFNFSLTQKSGFKLVDVMIMMIVDFFIYFLLTLYVDNLSPGPQELGQPWNYFFENLRCRFIGSNKENMGDKTPKQSRSEMRKNRKNDPNAAGRALSVSTAPVIEFKKLSKKFYMIDGVFGLENVQFTVYQGITVLLGHKDSGRTTLFRLVCGAYAPSSGTVVVFNCNVRKDIQKVQSYLNVCMESDMLCEYLTVMEHMQLIAKLKGIRGQEAKEEIKNILESLGLLSQRNDLMYRLAKWQRRVLCVAMSLIGDAPILLLDEPTLGLDLDAKRQIWNLLKELKMEGKTIVMSTHNVEEAYQIADKIVIMSRGRVAGAGSPAKLESLFETGYHLTVGAVPNAKADEILKFLQQYVPGAREREGSLKRVHKAIQVENWEKESQSQTGIALIKGVKRSKTVVTISGAKDAPSTTTKDKERKSRKSIKTLAAIESAKPRLSGSDPNLLLDIEIVYVLPARERNTFSTLFKTLDDGKSALNVGIKYYDLALHTIENAFDEIDDYVDVLNATGSSQDLLLDDFVDTMDTKTKAIKFLMDEPPVSMPEHKFGREKTYCSWWTAVFAIIIKRVSHAIGNYRHATVQILLPIFILLIALNSTNRYFSHDLMSPAIFYNTSLELHTPVVPYRIKDNDPKAKDFSNYYKKVIEGPPNDIKNFISFGTENFSSHYDEKHLYKLHDEAVFAADFTKVDDSSKVIALFSPGHRHSGPLSLLLMFNALLDYEIPDGKYGVSMAGLSMSHSAERIFLLNSTYPDTIMESGADITLTVALAFGLFIFASGFVTQPCSERICNLKRYQMYNIEWNGLYWVACSMIDLFFNAIQILLLTLVIYYAPGHNVFKHPQFIILFVITGTLGGFSSILASYNWSHYWPKTATSYYITLSLNQFFGLFLFLFYTIINYEKFGQYTRAGVIFFLQCLQPFIVPWNFYVAIAWATFNGRCRALNPIVINELCSAASDNIENIKELRGVCCTKGFGESKSFDFLWNNSRPDVIVNPLWSNFAFLVAHCVGGILILMYMESRRFRRKLLYLHSTEETPPAIINASNLGSLKREEMFVKEELPDLEEENRNSFFRVESLSTSVDKRSLLYPMSFVAEPGKPLVIVGPETAGISVLFEILAGLRAISEGFVSHGGYSLFSWNTRKKFLQHLGLCPSKDITLDKLTGDQMLYLFARLRGIPEESIQKHVDYWVDQLGLETKIKKQCGSYSLAFKRKLAVSLAVIGNPPVLIFEEPTKDLDPLSKTQVLKVIDSLCAAGRSIIILTHNLGSVQSVCSKLIIIVNGQMQFCDKSENIYEEIAEEFTLTIKLKGDENGRIDFKAFQAFVTEIEAEIESMTLQEEQSHLLLYRVKNVKYSWASLFETTEKVTIKHPEVVLDYSLRKTSMEDVYNSYAGKQRLFRTEESAWEDFLTTYC